MKDLNQAFSAVCKHKDFISDFHTPAGTQYLITDPVILQLVASQFRNEENGLFSVPENERLFIDIIAKDLYPEETAAITDREKELVSAILFTAESAHVPHLRASLLGFLKQKAVQEYKGEIDKIAHELIDSLTDEEKLSCDSSALVFEFAISVICKLFMGYEGSREKYGKIVRALVSIGKRISDSILHQTQTTEEKKEYQTALSTIRELTQCNILAFLSMCNCRF